MNAVNSETPPTNDVHFQTLTNLVRSGGCVVVLGAGVSAPDYPLWKPLAKNLCNSCGVETTDLPSGELIDLCEAAKTKNEATFNRVLLKTFSLKKRSAKCASRYHLLSRLNFLSYVTLNYDPMLVSTLDLHRNVDYWCYPYLPATKLERGNVFHIHGKMTEGSKNIVLTRSDFQYAYDPSRTLLHAFLQNMLLEHVCFLGCNPAEPNLQRIVEACRGITDTQFGLTGQKPYWFLLQDSGSEDVESIEKSGISVVKYPYDSGYAGLDDVLAYWANKKSPKLGANERATSVFSSTSELPRP